MFSRYRVRVVPDSVPAFSSLQSNNAAPEQFLIVYVCLYQYWTQLFEGILCDFELSLFYALLMMKRLFR